MKKKKKKLLKPSIKKYYECLFERKIKFYKIAHINTFRLAFLMNVNKQLSTITKLMEKNNLIINDILTPSIVKEYSVDITIKPFWNNKIETLSNKLYLPSSENLYASYDHNKTFSSNTWFNIEQYVNIDKPYKLLIKNINKDINNVIKTKQIKLFLDKEQKKYMQIVIGTYRYYYNRCVSYLNNYNKNTKTSWYLINPLDENTKINLKIEENPHNFMDMRKILKENPPNWLLNQFPVHLIDKALKECFDRFNICLDNYFKTRKPFKFNYKSKRDIVQTINIEKQMISKKSNGLFSRWKINNNIIFKNIKTHDKLADFEIQDSSISYHTVLKSYILNLVNTIKSNPTNNKDIASIDQGIRTPFVVYSTKEVIKIGSNCTDKIKKVCKEIDIIQSRINKKSYYVKDNNGNKKYYNVTSKRKRNLRKAMHKKIQYVKNLKKELHNKSIRYLCDNFSAIILPPFKTKEMVSNLHTTTARMMCTLSFYQFKTKLKNKAKEYNINILEKTEPFTSKTCGNCGNIRYDLGSAEYYNCNKCHLEIDRDINGARNILLRNIEYC